MLCIYKDSQGIDPITSMDRSFRDVLNSLLVFNPVAMTCGAIGAIVYGWSALSTKEQDAILQQIQDGLEIGVELIKSLIQFVIVKIKSLLDTKYLEELKDFIASQAQNFGKTLSDVTRATSDKISETVNKTIEAGKDVGGDRLHHLWF